MTTHAAHLFDQAGDFYLVQSDNKSIKNKRERREVIFLALQRIALAVLSVKARTLVMCIWAELIFGGQDTGKVAGG